MERLFVTVDFEMFRPVLAKALRRGAALKGGRPPFDPVLKFKMLVLQSLHGLSLARTSYMVRDRLSWVRFCGLGAGDTVPDANTLWDFREALIKAKAREREDGAPQIDIAIPTFGYKNHVSIDRRHGIANAR